MNIARTLAAALIALLLLAPSAAAHAAVPSPVAMTFVQNGETYETLGFTATGAISDSGDWDVTRLVLGSPKTLLFGDVDTIQTTPHGTFRLQWHGGTTPVGGVAATWRLTDGTGAYKGLRGEGRWSQEFSNGLITFTCWGVVHRAP